MGTVLSKRRDRRAGKLELELDTQLDTPASTFHFDREQKLRIKRTLSEATGRKSSLVIFPGEELPRTVFDNDASRAHMLGQIEKFCRKKATTSPQTLFFYFYSTVPQLQIKSLICDVCSDHFQNPSKFYESPGEKFSGKMCMDILDTVGFWANIFRFNS